MTLQPLLSVVIHDVAPATQGACERLLSAVADVGDLPLTLLAVPRYHCQPRSREFERWLYNRWASGDEIALHGYTHQDDGQPRGMVDRLRRRVYTRGEGEFWDLTPDEAVLRLDAGVQWFRSLGLPLHGFIAPAWLMGEGAWAALRHFNLEYTCTLRSLYLLRERQRLVSQGVVYSTSTAWRRACSVVWNRAVATAQRQCPVLRLELHPGDAEHPEILRSWQPLLDAELKRRRPTTLADVASRRFLFNEDMVLQ